jgi:chloramphenicol-sensitive protein RarD
MVLKSAPPLELLGHRVVWSIAFVLGVLAATRRWGWIRGVLRSRAILLASAASATALALNWLLYIWAVNTDRNVDASLGYFINPLLSIALGAVVLRERLSRVRWIAVACASAGVLWLIVQLGQVPWIGLGLAVTFGSYGLLRKTAALGALEGLALELLLLLPFAAGLLGWLAFTGHGHVVAQGPRFELLILLLGPVTAVPLLLFAAGARRIPLYLVGLLQYIGPTLQLCAGVLVGHEPFGSTKIVGYALVWLAFALASTEGLLAVRRANGVTA